MMNPRNWIFGFVAIIILPSTACDQGAGASPCKIENHCIAEGSGGRCR